MIHPEEIAKNLPALFSALLVAILFIQSGLDKVFEARLLGLAPDWLLRLTTSI